MTRARLALGLAALGLVAAAGVALTRPHSAEIVLPGGGERQVFQLRPMIGLHSDWHRAVVVRDGDGRRRIRLIQDTGWWRGSQLYRRPDGALVLDEGQAGCVLLSGSGGPPGCPRGDDWTYLGRFTERGSDHARRAVFLGPDAAEEVRLPDPL